MCKSATGEREREEGREGGREGGGEGGREGREGGKKKESTRLELQRICPPIQSSTNTNIRHGRPF